MRAHVSAVQLTNNTDIRTPQILSRLKMKAGRAITNARVQKEPRTSEIFGEERAFERAGGGATRGVRCGEEQCAADSGCDGRATRKSGSCGREIFKWRFEEAFALLPGRRRGYGLLEEGKKNLRERWNGKDI